MDTIKAVVFFQELRSGSTTLLASTGQMFKNLEGAWALATPEARSAQRAYFNRMLHSTGLSTSQCFVSSESRLIPVLRDPFEQLCTILLDRSVELPDEELWSLQADDIAAGLLRLKMFLDLFCLELGLQRDSYLKANAGVFKLAGNTVEFPVYTGVEFDRLAIETQQSIASTLIYLTDLRQAVIHLRDSSAQLQANMLNPASPKTAMAVSADVFSATYLPKLEALESELASNTAETLIASTFSEIIGHYLMQGHPPQMLDEHKELYDIPEFVATGLQRLYVLALVAGWPFETLERIRLLALNSAIDLRELSLRMPDFDD
jgi:hypothetical protein